MIENIDRITRYVADHDQHRFGHNDLVPDAVERCLERICGAAYRLGDRAAFLMPDQPWADIRGMGNRLRHGYDRVSLKIVWNTIQYRQPSLRDDVERCLRKFDPQN